MEKIFAQNDEVWAEFDTMATIVQKVEIEKGGDQTRSKLSKR